MIRRALLLALLLGGVVAARAGAQDPASGFLEQALKTGILPNARRAEFPDVRAVLDTFYATRGYQPIWDYGAGYGEVAQAAVVALRAAEERGLTPSDYESTRLDSFSLVSRDPNAARRAERDLLLTVAVIRYLRDLRDGRVAITPFGHLKTETPAPADAALLRRAASGEPIETLAAEVEPHLTQYRNLLRLLAQYRALADTFQYRRLTDRSVRPGQAYAGAAELRRRLIAFGDLDPSLITSPTVYDSTLMAGVQNFQRRHALTPDGLLGPDTRRALNVTPLRRVRQLVLALERLRWLPPLDGARLLVVNIPAFELAAFDSIGGSGAPAFTMPVVIGSAFDHRTPVMLQPLRQVEFHPFWNVPRSILTREIIPLLGTDSLYLRRNQMEILGRRDTILGDSITPRLLAGLTQGRYRVRQRPGPWNSLGLTKFTFPNTDDVYLHGTPERSGFRRARRDLSHGCIRLQDPAKLAEWALSGDGWDRATIDSVLRGDADTVRAPVLRPTTILLYYATAVAMPDGEARFYDDIYGHDRPLLATLAARGRREGA